MIECKPADHCSPLDPSSFCRPQGYWFRSTIPAFWEMEQDHEAPILPASTPQLGLEGHEKPWGKYQ